MVRAACPQIPHISNTRPKTKASCQMMNQRASQSPLASSCVLANSRHCCQSAHELTNQSAPVMGVSPARITYDRIRTSHIQRVIRTEENINMTPNMGSCDY